MIHASPFVAEMQGLYGPFTMTERVVQKMWLQQDFAVAGATLEDGRPLEVLFPGHWNLLGGPDFKDACLRVAGREIRGDIEVHFRVADWQAHGHRANPEYANVVLHVLLFPPGLNERAARAANGREIPALVLLPRLHRDLEEYAADDALETITARDEWRRTAELAHRPVSEVRKLLRELAIARWHRKVHYARLRIERLGWEDAVHHTALEILGYRHNRVPMLAVAAKWPLAAWRGAVDVKMMMESVGQGTWRRHGVRPANYPLVRLQQYAAWVARRPDWPARLASHAAAAGSARNESESISQFRRDLELTNLSARLAHDWTGESVSGSRWHTLVCDGLLPLAAAQTGEDWAQLWFNWFPGDFPDQIRVALRKLGIAGRRQEPFCHGFAQGLLAWFIQREVSP